MKKIFYNNIGVYSDACLYKAGYNNYIKVMSIYGSPQQVKAVGSALLNFRELVYKEENNDMYLTRLSTNYRMKIFSLGYGKSHCLVWEDRVGSSYIFWITPEDKYTALRQALSKRKIPYENTWLANLEELLIQDMQLIKIDGWGIQGYELVLRDDDACDLITKKINTESWESFDKEKEAKTCCMQ